MENTQTSLLTSRLQTLADSSEGRIAIYQEADRPVGRKLRAIWQDVQLTESLLAAIDGNTVSVCVLARQNSLLGLELMGACIDSLSDSFATMEAVECFILERPLANLQQPGLLVMDMDSTAIKIECIDELAAMAGVGEAVAEVTERAMQGELDFEQSLRLRVSKLAGADAGIIDDLCARLPLMEGLTEMLAELKSHGWRLVVASGGFTPFVGHLKQTLGLDAAFANELVIADGKLIGEVSGTVVDANYKAEVVSRLGTEYGIGAGQRVAIGDGANDIPMVQRADFGIAFHAKPKLAAAADASIKSLDLRVLPFLLQA